MNHPTYLLNYGGVKLKRGTCISKQGILKMNGDDIKMRAALSKWNMLTQK
jgi:hypothetical protein